MQCSSIASSGTDGSARRQLLQQLLDAFGGGMTKHDQHRLAVMRQGDKNEKRSVVDGIHTHEKPSSPFSRPELQHAVQDAL